MAIVTATFKTQEARDAWVEPLKKAIKPSHDEAGTLSYQLSYGVQNPCRSCYMRGQSRTIRCLAIAGSSPLRLQRVIEAHPHDVAITYYSWRGTAILLWLSRFLMSQYASRRRSHQHILCKGCF